MSLVILDVPGECVAQGRPRGVVMGKRVRMYDPKRSRDYKSLVAMAAGQVMEGRELLTGALTMEVTVYKVPPKSMSKKKRTEALAGNLRPVTRPDIDNYLKGVKDGLTKIVYHDDSQIVDVKASKYYGEPARTRIVVKEMEIAQCG